MRCKSRLRPRPSNELSVFLPRHHAVRSVLVVPPRRRPVPKLLRAAFLLFMVFGIPALIMLPFLLAGFIGRS